ncbi:MotA/TolQ/ExbB proton channel family protein [Nitratidesulfovibrio sp. 1201_IL3209]|uniref:MotA/TolQ/ExbB proton channel family protein n=1 Tax=Nitratidesulfovibrio sp. 1201_IL3209 TaxID=3084053 RepID=UPI003FA6083E
MDASMLQLIAQATPVAKAVLAMLVVMSLASWAVICAKWRTLERARRGIAQGIADALSAPGLTDLLHRLDGCGCGASPLRRMARLGVDEFNRLARTGDADRLLADNVRRTLRHGVGEEIRRLSRALPLLATTANTAPFIGLFGTVWGVMHSFQSIGQMKSASLATVAPGISEALVATALGLAVAIPAAMAYNVLLGRLATLEGQCISFAGLLLNRLQHEANAHAQGIALSGGRG